MSKDTSKEIVKFLRSLKNYQADEVTKDINHPIGHFYSLYKMYNKKMDTVEATDKALEETIHQFWLSA